MTIKHNTAPGEAPPLPPSVPLVERWNHDDPNGPGFLSWQLVPSDQWPADLISRAVYDMARQNPGHTVQFKDDDGSLYRVTWSVGPQPDSIKGRYGALTVDPGEALANEIEAKAGRMMAANESAAYVTNGPKGPRQYAYEAQERLFPARHPAEAAMPPMLPEICITVRDSIVGDTEAWPKEQLQETRAMLAARLETWDHSEGGKFALENHVFDSIICNLVRRTVEMIDMELALRAECGAEF